MYTHFQSGSFIRTKSSASSRGGQPASRLQTDKPLQTNNSTELGGHLVLNAPLELVPAGMRLSLHIRGERSLCGAEGQLEVVPGLGGVEGGVLEGVREETVHQGTEGYPIFPTRREVLDVHLLFER